MDNRYQLSELVKAYLSINYVTFFREKNIEMIGPYICASLIYHRKDFSK